MMPAFFERRTEIWMLYERANNTHEHFKGGGFSRVEVGQASPEVPRGLRIRNVRDSR